MPALFDFTREGEYCLARRRTGAKRRGADLRVLGRALLGNGPCVGEDIDRKELSTRPDLIKKLVPPHAEPALRSQGIDIDDFVPIPLEQLRISLDVSIITSFLCRVAYMTS